jgi:protein-disulfide isomerase
MPIVKPGAQSFGPATLIGRVTCLLIGIGLCLAATVAPVMGAEFTAEQRAEIIQIVREALKTDPSILRDAVEAYQADQAAHQAATARALIAAHHDAIYDQSDAAVGSDKPDVTIVEFFDPRCPYCRGLESAMAAWLRQDPNIRLVYKDLPILGAPSVLGSRALLAAQRQGGYVALRAAIMEDPPNFTDASIRADAEKLGLDWSKMQRDMDDPAIQQRIDNNVRLAKLLGIEGTPAFVIGDRLVVGSDVTEIQHAVAAIRGPHG